jgi:hypothetical protein
MSNQKTILNMQKDAMQRFKKATKLFSNIICCVLTIILSPIVRLKDSIGEAWFQVAEGWFHTLKAKSHILKGKLHVWELCFPVSEWDFQGSEVCSQRSGVCCLTSEVCCLTSRFCFQISESGFHTSAICYLLSEVCFPPLKTCFLPLKVYFPTSQIEHQPSSIYSQRSDSYFQASETKLPTQEGRISVSNMGMSSKAIGTQIRINVLPIPPKVRSSGAICNLWRQTLSLLFCITTSTFTNEVVKSASFDQKKLDTPTPSTNLSSTFRTEDYGNSHKGNTRDGKNTKAIPSLFCLSSSYRFSLINIHNYTILYYAY